MNEGYTYNIDKYTITVDKYGKDKIGLTIAIIENNEINFLGSCNGNNARCIDLLIRENQELKKQLEEKENQQKEFIEYIKKNIKHYKEIIRLDRENNAEQDCRRFETRWATYEEILSKYKEIIGDKDE